MPEIIREAKIEQIGRSSSLIRSKPLFQPNAIPSRLCFTTRARAYPHHLNSPTHSLQTSPPQRARLLSAPAKTTHTLFSSLCIALSPLSGWHSFVSLYTRVCCKRRGACAYCITATAAALSLFRSLARSSFRARGEEMRERKLKCPEFRVYSCV